MWVVPGTRTKRGEKFLLCDFAEVLVIRGEEQLREGAISAPDRVMLGRGLWTSSSSVVMGGVWRTLRSIYARGNPG